MINLNTYIIEKLHLNKDTKLEISEDCITLKSIVEQYDIEAGEVIENWAIQNTIKEFLLLFPSNEQIDKFKKIGDRINANFSNIDFINIGVNATNQFKFYKYATEIIDENINANNCSNILKKYIVFDNKELSIYIGKYPKKGLEIRIHNELVCLVKVK